MLLQRSSWILKILKTLRTHLAEPTWRNPTWRNPPGGTHLEEPTWRNPPGGNHLAEPTFFYNYLQVLLPLVPKQILEVVYVESHQHSNAGSNLGQWFWHLTSLSWLILDKLYHYEHEIEYQHIFFHCHVNHHSFCFAKRLFHVKMFKVLATLNSLINKHARLAFTNFFPPYFQFFM